MSGPTPSPSLIAARPGVVVAIAVGLAVVLLALAFTWEGDSASPSRSKRIVDAVDVVVPAPLRDEELKETASGAFQERVALESGAWVQVADEAGRLQQRYRAKRIDPEPDRWMRMEQPHAVLFPSEGRVVTMRADRGRARVPKRAIQAGRLDGNVVIRVFRAQPGGRVAFDGDEPVGEPLIVINAEEAQFDEVLGEIRCDRWVDFHARQEREVEGRTEITTVAFKGEGLSISVDTGMKSIERLVVERAQGPIVITREGGLDTDPLAAVPRLAPTTEPVMAAQAVAEGAGDTGAPPVPTVPAVPTVPPTPTAPTAPAVAAGTQAAPAVAEGAPAVSPADARSERDLKPYRLTLHDNVVVRRINQGRESVVRGDRLVAIFAMESDGLKNALASLGGLGSMSQLAHAECTSGGTGLGDGSTPAHRDGGASLAGALEWWSLPNAARLSLLAFAAPQSEQPSMTPADAVDLITIHYDGRLVMVPVTDERDALESADDVRLAVEAQEVGGRRFVEVEDVRTLSRARCDRLVYRGATDTIDLEGSVAQPFTLTSPSLDLQGGAFHFDRASGLGEVGGAGRMRLGDDDQRKPAAGGDRAKAADAASVGAGLPRELDITWTRGLDIQLADEKSGGRIRNAHFRGDVKVDSPDFTLATQGLRVYFKEGRENEVERIRAEGDSVATRLGDEGRLAAQVIDVAIHRDERGRTVPKVMEARGRVEASDRNQTMWSDDLQVHFRPKRDEPAEAGAAPRAGDPDLGSVEVERVIAGTLTELAEEPLAAGTGTVDTTTGGAQDAEAARAPRGVQMLLRDGARVFAQRLEGEALSRQVELLGPDVMIVQKNLVADGLSHLKIDEGARSVTANGPGRFRYFREPVTDATPSPRDRPAPSGPVSLDATWSDRMHYDDRGNGGGGSIDLEGGVRVRAGRTDREFSALDAKTVQLDFQREPEGRGTRRPDAAGAGDATGRGDGLRADDGFGSGSRRIQRLIAKNEARLENQTWETPERIGEPRLFRVTGDHVEYDTISGEALVAGAGTLLVHDTTGGGAGGGVDARGTSRFKWTTSMDMRQLGSQRFLVTMKDGVEVLHSGVKQGDTLTLTCDTLETTLLRPGVGVEPDARAGGRPDAATGAGDIDLGGAAELQRVRGLGRVMVRAPDADIECDEFDYDIRTQIAQLKGRDGRLVKVLRSGTAAPIQAASVLWDRQSGRMTVQSGSGAMGR